MVKWPEEMDRWTEVARPFDSIVNKNKQTKIILMQLFKYVYKMLQLDMVTDCRYNRLDDWNDDSYISFYKWWL